MQAYYVAPSLKLIQAKQIISSSVREISLYQRRYDETYIFGNPMNAGSTSEAHILKAQKMSRSIQLVEAPAKES